jgi:hypothetical protein
LRNQRGTRKQTTSGITGHTACSDAAALKCRSGRTPPFLFPEKQSTGRTGAAALTKQDKKGREREHSTVPRSSTSGGFFKKNLTFFHFIFKNNTSKILFADVTF